MEENRSEHTKYIKLCEKENINYQNLWDDITVVYRNSYNAYSRNSYKINDQRFLSKT